jgi:sirohydrochlorin cobaltochelatase
MALMMLASPALAAGKGGKEAKEAILLVAFGTSAKKALVSYTNVEKEVKAAFPGQDVRWAWTAHSLLKSDPKNPRLSLQEALAKLAIDDVRKVYILSLHVIPGIEYSNIVHIAHAVQGLPKGIEEIKVSTPLLFTAESVAKVAEALMADAPKGRKADEALVFVGHGTSHAAGVYYPALQYYLSLLDKNAFVGTLDFEKGDPPAPGSPGQDDILKALKANGIRKVWLAPLMTVAGEHTANDLFGDEEDSWKEVFKANDLAVETVNKGLGEYPAWVTRWVDSLKKIVND